MNKGDLISREEVIRALRLIDADALLDHVRIHCGPCGEAVECIVEAPTIDPVHAAGGCYCDECVMSNDECMAEFRFREEGVKNPFCCLGYPLIEDEDGFVINPYVE